MTKKTVFGLPENLAGVAAYIIPVVSGIVLLVCERENKFVRFHSLQAVIWFGALFVLQVLIGWLPLIGGLLHWALGLVGGISWIYLMWMAYKGSNFKLPVIGDVVSTQIDK